MESEWKGSGSTLGGKKSKDLALKMLKMMMMRVYADAFRAGGRYSGARQTQIGPGFSHFELLDPSSKVDDP